MSAGARFSLLQRAADRKHLFTMDKKPDESRDVAPSKTLLDDNWNERKHLVELEFQLRSITEELIEKNAPKDELDNARRQEAACRAALTKNSDQYEALVTAWMGEMSRDSLPSS
jgi:primosomal protein N''